MTWRRVLLFIWYLSIESGLCVLVLAVTWMADCFGLPLLVGGYMAVGAAACRLRRPRLEASAAGVIGLCVVLSALAPANVAPNSAATSGRIMSHVASILFAVGVLAA